MKKIVFYLFITLFVINISNVKAQRCCDRSKMKSYKVSFITEKLSLTPEESQKFWPLYNEMYSKIHKENKALKSLLYKYKDSDYKNIDSKEAKKVLDDILLKRKNIAEIYEEYIRKISKTLPPNKVLKLLTLEKEFNRGLLHRIYRRGRHRIK